MIKYLAIPDLHGKYYHRPTFRLLEDFYADFKPDKVIYLGDVIDVEGIGTYIKNETAVPSLAEEFKYANDFFDRISPSVVLEGNHEERLRRPSNIHPSMWDVVAAPAQFNLASRGAVWIPYDHRPHVGTYKLGKLRFLHGFWANMWAARKHAEAYGCVVFAHTHRIQTFQPTTAHLDRCGENIGCCCRLDAEWTLSNPPRGWMHGFGFGYVHKSGNFQHYTAKLVGRSIVINDKLYIRS